MMPQIRVEREDNERLTKRRWQFQFDDRHARLVLSEYMEMARPTRRHDYRVDRGYFWSDHRNDTIALADIPLPDDVKAEAKLLFCETVTVTKGETP